MAKQLMSLLFLQISKTSDSTPDCGGSGGAEYVGTAGDGLLAGATPPYADTVPLHGLFATESAAVLRVLSDFHLFNHFSERRSITGTIFTDDSHFLCSLRLLINGLINYFD